MAATFDPMIARRHGEIVSTEYRALGITTALSPQADLSTDPRWRRFYGTFSESPELNRDIVREYCDAFQTTPESKDGWGTHSVNCMVKHWPGGGTGEGGRDAHFGTGKRGSDSATISFRNSFATSITMKEWSAPTGVLSMITIKSMNTVELHGVWRQNPLPRKDSNASKPGLTNLEAHLTMP